MSKCFFPTDRTLSLAPEAQKSKEFRNKIKKNIQQHCPSIIKMVLFLVRQRAFVFAPGKKFLSYGPEIFSCKQFCEIPTKTDWAFLWFVRKSTYVVALQREKLDQKTFWKLCSLMSETKSANLVPHFEETLRNRFWQKDARRSLKSGVHHQSLDFVTVLYSEISDYSSRCLTLRPHYTVWVTPIWFHFFLFISVFLFTVRFWKFINFCSPIFLFL